MKKIKIPVRLGTPDSALPNYEEELKKIFIKMFEEYETPEAVLNHCEFVLAEPIEPEEEPLEP